MNPVVTTEADKPGIGSLRPSIPALLILAACTAGIALVGYDLLARSPLSWHLRQGGTIHGGLEALALLAILLAFAATLKRWLAVAAALACLLYLRRHHAELSLGFGLFYLEALLALGVFLRRMAGVLTNHLSARLLAFVLGLSVWVMLSVALSLFHLARPGSLLLLLTIAGLGLILHRPDLATVRLFVHARHLPRGQRMLLAALTAWFLVLAARTANVLGHDVVWYIGQGDRLLAPTGSIFDSLGLVSAVHYFPKLWETLLLPATVFDDIRIQLGIGIGVLAVFLAAVWCLAGSLRTPMIWRWWLLLVLATLPAIANTALTLKTDLISAVFLIVMSVMLLRWLRWRDTGALAYAAACAALACSGKLTAIPYVAIALLLTALMEVRHHVAAKDDRRPMVRASAIAVWTCASAIAVATALLLRTWWLAGVPTIGPDPLMAVWTALGFSLTEPAGTLQWTWPQNWAEVPQLLRDWLFLPSSMPKILIGWTGNVWFVLLVCATGASLLGLRNRHPATMPGTQALLIVLTLLGLVLAVGWRYHSRGSDGNYFLFAIAMVTTLAIHALSGRISQQTIARTALACCLGAYAMFHATYAFITTAWSPPGTRTLDAQLLIPPWQPALWRKSRLENDGLGVIAEHLADRPRNERGVAYGPAHMQTPVLLPIAFEELRSIGYSRPEYTADGGALMQYMNRFEVRHLLLPVDEPDLPPVIASFRTAVLQSGWTAVTDSGGILYSNPVQPR